MGFVPLSEREKIYYVAYEECTLDVYLRELYEWEKIKAEDTFEAVKDLIPSDAKEDLEIAMMEYTKYSIVEIQ